MLNLKNLIERLVPAKTLSNIITHLTDFNKQTVKRKTVKCGLI